ncbi:MAG: hypothetical protein ABIQ32_02690 [Sphingomicrobium sp.]
MRSMSILIAAAILASCSTAPQPGAYDARDQARLQQLLAGKTAGRAITCLPSYRSSDMIRISDDVVAFQDGPGRVYVSNLRGSCSGLSDPSYALVTNTIGSGSLCSGDIARVVDLTTHMTVGSCALGDFIPYTRTGA